MKLVGASNWFVRGPFVLEGIACGLIGSVLAVLLLVLGKELALPQIIPRARPVTACSVALPADGGDPHPPRPHSRRGGLCSNIPPVPPSLISPSRGKLLAPGRSPLHAQPGSATWRRRTRAPASNTVPSGLAPSAAPQEPQDLFVIVELSRQGQAPRRGAVLHARHADHDRSQGPEGRRRRRSRRGQHGPRPRRASSVSSGRPTGSRTSWRRCSSRRGCERASSPTTFQSRAYEGRTGPP